MDKSQEYLMNAEVAFSGKQYEEALRWYKKVLEETPGDIRALSRAGALSVTLGQYEDSLKYFGKARELDPQNGDILFNYGNACFFNNDNVAAFDAYVDAERAGCSEDVAPRLFYQMGLICSMRQDIKSALLYFKKLEDVDKTGILSLNPDLISEKLKLAMASEDMAGAEKAAAQLVAIDPMKFGNYMIYFGILMSSKNYDKAEKVIADCEGYAEMTDAEKAALPLEKAAVYIARGNDFPELQDACYGRAIDLLEGLLKDDSLTKDQRNDVLFSLSDVYMKSGKFELAKACLTEILEGPKPRTEETAPETFTELTPEDIAAMLEDDVHAAAESMEFGGFDDVVDDGFAADIPVAEEKPAEEEPKEETTDEYAIAPEVREKACFSFLSCYLAQDDFEAAKPFARILRASDNKYYSYYGRYTSALCELKTKGKTDEVDKLYGQTTTFFRNRTLADPKDGLAVIFRVRMYAELGKFDKAEELASLLADADGASVSAYIEQCREGR